MSDRATTSNAATSNAEEKARLKALINSDDLAFSSLTYEDLGIDPSVDDYISPFDPSNFGLAPSTSRGGGGGRGGRRRQRTMQVQMVGLRTPPHGQDAQPVAISNEGLDDLVLDGGAGGSDGVGGGDGGGDGGGSGGNGGRRNGRRNGRGGGGGGGGDGGGGDIGDGGSDGGDDGDDDEFDQMNDPGDNEYHEPFRYFRTRRDREPNSIVEYRTVVVTYKNRARSLVLRARRERRIRPEENAAAQRGHGIGRRLMRGHHGSYRVQRGQGRGHGGRSGRRRRWR